MKKQEQEKMNKEALDIFNKAVKEYYLSFNKERLDYCQAFVSETVDYYFLTSYNTLIGVIDKQSDTLVDVLRFVYGYTATSAKHIAKFRKYGKGKWGCEHELTYRQI